MNNFSDAFDIYLELLDNAYSDVRFWIADPTMLNTDFDKYKKARNNFEQIMKDIQRFKEVWASVKRLPVE